jgi:Putative abortive phage resistance protein AbiGi, antitoxin
VPSIQDVLGRRRDLSTFVVHLTRRTNQSARMNLRAMLKEQRLRAVTAMGAAASRLELNSRAWNSQRVVSFTEAPLDELHSFFTAVDERRRNRFQPYGVAFTKMQARRMGITPVWYTVANRAEHWRVNHVWNLVDAAQAAGDFRDSDIAQLTPFIDLMGYLGPGKRKEFWWEREWRHLGSLRFEYEDVALGLCPEDRIEEFGRYMRLLARRRGDVTAEAIRWIDPRWGLEKIVAVLAGVPADQLSPFDA